MFIIDTEQDETGSRESRVLLKAIKRKMGDVLPHFALLGTIDPQLLSDLLQYVNKVDSHPTIQPDLFPFIRLHIAQRENYPYCIELNSKILKSRGYSAECLERVKRDMSDVPLDQKNALLGTKAIKAIYQPGAFSKNDLQELYQLHWTDKEIFDAIDHAGFLLKNGRIITAYMK